MARSSYQMNLSEGQKIAIMTALQSVADEGRDERIQNLRDRIAELKSTIDCRMRLRERIVLQFQTVTGALTSLESQPQDHGILISLFTSHGSYLKRRMAEVRPDAELKRKSELEADLSMIMANRDLAIQMQRELSPALYV